jgi:hypothetical protein
MEHGTGWYDCFVQHAAEPPTRHACETNEFERRP